MGVEAFDAETAVEDLDGWLAGPGEVQRDAALVGPQVKITRHEYAALIDADRRREAHLLASPFQHRQTSARAGPVKTAASAASLDRPEHGGTTAGVEKIGVSALRDQVCVQDRVHLVLEPRAMPARPDSVAPPACACVRSPHHASRFAAGIPQSADWRACTHRSCRS